MVPSKNSNSPHKKNLKGSLDATIKPIIEQSTEPDNSIDRKADFIKELEFIQLLCNPEYLKWLYTEKYFSNPDFKDFLKYLMYFSKPEYLKFLVYPQCVPILELLTQDNADDLLAEELFYSKLVDIQHCIWKNRQ